MLKRVVVACAAAAVLVAGCGEPFLTYEEQFPDFKAPADKALCVVLRPMGGLGGLKADAFFWVDGVVVGGTGPNSITSFTVEPGEHIVTTKMNTSGMQSFIKIPARVKFNFQPGKIYFILQAVYPVGIGVATSLVPMDGADAMEKIQQERGSSKYALRNPANTEAEDLSAEDLAEEREDWDKWAAEKPEDARKETEYPGY